MPGYSFHGRLSLAVSIVRSDVVHTRFVRPALYAWQRSKPQYGMYTYHNDYWGRAQARLRQFEENH